MFVVDVSQDVGNVLIFVVELFFVLCIVSG